MSKVYLARDMIFHTYKGCSSKGEAEDFINSWSGKGYIEVYKKEGDRYYYDNDYSVVGERIGTLMGPDLLGQGIHQKYAHIILNL